MLVASAAADRMAFDNVIHMDPCTRPRDARDV
jgi:hypothetical protein